MRKKINLKNYHDREGGERELEVKEERRKRGRRGVEIGGKERKGRRGGREGKGEEGNIDAGNLESNIYSKVLFGLNKMSLIKNSRTSKSKTVD